jgi:hypothetical protein
MIIKTKLDQAKSTIGIQNHCTDTNRRNLFCVGLQKLVNDAG